MGRVEGKVAFITGAARGQGRSHAVRLAQEGADIIAIDVCEPINAVPYDPATEEDLAETVRQVEALDRRIVATKADVRDMAQVQKAIDDGVAQLGRLDIVSANAGISGRPNRSEDIPDDEWTDMLDINLSGVWRAVRASIPHLKAGGRGGGAMSTLHVTSFAVRRASRRFCSSFFAQVIASGSSNTTITRLPAFMASRRR
mgnify:CR=1 FL=1